MGAKSPSRWQQIKTHRVTTIWIALFVTFAVLVILGGYKFNWDWTGFNGNNKSGKTFIVFWSRSTMHQELCAYLIRDDGRVSELPTEELLVALDQLRQASSVQRQIITSDKVTVYEFLQTVKWIMRRLRQDRQASEKAKGT